MRWASAVSRAAEVSTAVREAAAPIAETLGRERPDVVLAFVSAEHAGGYDRVPSLVAEQLRPRVLVGCSAGGVVGGGREVEQAPGVSLTAAVLPDVEVVPFHIESHDAWSSVSARLAGADPHFVLLPDPFTFDAEAFVRQLDDVFPGGRSVGGLASGGRQPGATALFCDAATHRTGLVGLAMTGNLMLETVVAQGCRPIGDPMFVTRCERNLLEELDGRPAAAVLHYLYERADARERELFRHSLFLGLVMREREQAYRQGDFLIRNLVGMDPRTGALVVAATVRTGMVVQFHLRDAATSAQDVAELLARHAARAPSPAGALLFSCLGRGSHLYGRADHDTDEFRRLVGDAPLGGFFCNGEIGPVHGTTFLHGYTSAFGLFRPR